MKPRAALLVLFCGPFSLLASPAPAPSASPTPYPIASIVDEADQTAADIARMQSAIDGGEVSSELHKFLPELDGKISERIAESDRVMRSDAKISELQGLATSWIVLRDDVTLRLKLLNDKIAELDADSARLAQLASLWTLTKAAASAADAPDDTLNRIKSTLQQIAATNSALSAKLAKLLELQGSLANENTRITAQLASVQLARDNAMTNLVMRDSPPLWQFNRLAQSAKKTQTKEDFSPFGQLRQLGTYIFQQRGLIVLHLGIWAALVLLFRAAHRRVNGWIERDPSLEDATTVFQIPFATASLLAIWLGFPIYATAPPLFVALLGAALLIPLMCVVNRIIDEPLKPIIWALAAFYLASRIREAAEPFPVATRLIHLAETAGGVILAVWLLRRSRFAVTRQNSLLKKAVVTAARLGLVFFAAASIANILGYVNLATFVGAITLQGAYAGILLYAFCHIADGLVTFALNIPPLSLLSMVRHHRATLERRIAGCIRFVALLFWLAFTLDKMSLLDPVASRGAALLATPVFGPVSPGSILTFLLTVWASFLISRFIRFALEEDIYKRFPLKPGLPFAISTLIHYTILLLGFYLATAALIGDVGKFTILAGAFGVGIGFGLQNIVNNFVSGLIVLFERPVKIGDYVQVGGSTGSVQQIGIRATIIRADDGSEVIIPNANLIANPVINWTLTDRHRRLEIPVITSASSDAAQVISLIEQAAAANESICKSPAPQALLIKQTSDGTTFDLRVWTAEIRDSDRIRGDIAASISHLLAENKIAPGK